MLLIFFLIAYRVKGTIGIINYLTNFFSYFVYYEFKSTFLRGIVIFTGVLITFDDEIFFYSIFLVILSVCVAKKLLDDCFGLY